MQLLILTFSFKGRPNQTSHQKMKETKLTIQVNISDFSNLKPNFFQTFLEEQAAHKENHGHCLFIIRGTGR